MRSIAQANQRDHILSKLRAEIRRRAEAQKAQAEAQKAQAESEANMLCLCAEMLLGDQAEASARIAVEGETPAPNDRQELTAQELADIWKVTYRAIIKWKDEKGLPYKKVGRLLRFDWLEADAWSKRNRESFTKTRLRVVR
jgi:hypothetical protein